jgi:phosphoribosylglycinamide formyltransferase-1
LKPRPFVLGVLVSGSGTNLQAILDAIAQKRLDARVHLVLSNKAGVKALDRAAAAGVPTRVLSHKDFANRQAYDVELVSIVRAALGDSPRGWVVLAGFMRILTTIFIDAFPNRIVNIHPSLLPSFPGVNAQQQAVSHGVRISGCTVHLVDAGTDTGRILAQAAVPVLPTDDEHTLGARILEQEHQLLPAVLQSIAEGKLG